MGTSVFLAQLLGSILLVLSIGWLLNMKHTSKAIGGLFENATLYLIMGMLALTAGVAIVLTHNVWVKSWEVIITLLGWAALLKGVVRVVLPAWGMEKGKALVKNDGLMNASVLITLILGAILVYYGFFV